MEGLWGDDFVVIETPKETKKLLKKISEPKSLTAMPKKNSVASKKLSISERLELIKKLVFETLGKYEDATQVIQTRFELTSYIDKAIENGIIAIDTETNNSLDPITCKLMGPCIYTPGLNNVYIPLNHVDPNTNERLPQQLSEHDIAEEFSRLSNTKIIMHNGKFDYEVLKCTCGITLNIYWDTMICAKVLDENERSAGLKQQYIEKIDPSVEKYSIDQLFEDIEYAKVDPKVFALYAATDSYMTYKLYEWQNEQINLEENKSLLNIFHNVEMKLVPVIAEMEMAGMEVDQQYAALLSKKYHTLLDKVDDQIYDELANLKPQIDAWRLTEAANTKPAKKTGDGLGKSKSEQLEEPINLASPTQLAILFYDVLGAPIVDQKSPRGTGEAALKAIAEKLNLKICDLLLERREWVKLITTYVDVIPELAHRWPDGRVRTHFNQYGAATGRLSSSDPINFQNIPSHNKEIRMLFCAKDKFDRVDILDNNYVEIKAISQIIVNDKYTYPKDIKVGDMISIDIDGTNVELHKITSINLRKSNNSIDDIYTIYFL